IYHLSLSPAEFSARWRHAQTAASPAGRRCLRRSAAKSAARPGRVVRNNVSANRYPFHSTPTPLRGRFGHLPGHERVVPVPQGLVRTSGFRGGKRCSCLLKSNQQSALFWLTTDRFIHASEDVPVLNASHQTFAGPHLVGMPDNDLV